MKYNPIAEIKELLVQAFAEEIKHSVSLSHHDCVLLRQDLISLRVEDIKRCLPFVLIDLLETHTNDYRNIEDSDAVIRLLTPIETTSGGHPNATGLTRSEEEYVNQEQSKLFSAFSVGQAASIAKWLEEAKNWEDLCFCRTQIEIAHRYWTQRAS